jgi:hypothetical protein
VFGQSTSRAGCSAIVFLLFTGGCLAAEGPFFITYTHQMEEPGNLELSSKAVTASPSGGNGFIGAAAEFFECCPVNTGSIPFFL